MAETADKEARKRPRSERENLLLLRLAGCQAPKAPDFHHVTFLEVQELVAGSNSLSRKRGPILKSKGGQFAKCLLHFIISLEFRTQNYWTLLPPCLVPLLLWSLEKSLEEKLRDRNYRRIRGRGKSQDQYGCDDGAHPDHPLAIYRLFYHTLTLYLLMTLIVSREEEQQQQKSIAAIPMSV